jgi:hypothetical protein
MRLKLYCNRYAHMKDALVCSVNCAYRTRCRDFALYYDAHRAEVDAAVTDYYAARRETVRAFDASALAPAPVVALRTLIRLEVKREMAEVMYIWVDKEDRAELLGHEEVLRRAERGSKAKSIYKVSQEMELRFQLVPRKRIEKFKRAAEVEAERAEARRARAARQSGNAPVPFPAPAPAEEPAVAAAPARRARARAVKVAGGR